MRAAQEQPFANKERQRTRRNNDAEPTDAQQEQGTATDKDARAVFLPIFFLRQETALYYPCGFARRRAILSLRRACLPVRVGQNKTTMPKKSFWLRGEYLCCIFANDDDKINSIYSRTNGDILYVKKRTETSLGGWLGSDGNGSFDRRRICTINQRIGGGRLGYFSTHAGAVVGNTGCYQPKIQGIEGGSGTCSGEVLKYRFTAEESAAKGAEQPHP